MNVSLLPIIMSGFTTQAGIIVAVGAQNAFIIRQGIARSHILPIIAICIAADMTLIGIGTQGMGRIITGNAGLLNALTSLGAAVLGLYGIMAFVRVYRRAHAMLGSETMTTTTMRCGASNSTNANVAADHSASSRGVGTVADSRVASKDAADRSSLRSAIMQCLGFTFLNPSVYLDTIVLLGGIAATYGSQLKWSFASGAMMCSFVWFILLGLMSSKMSRLFRSDAAWIVLDSLIGLTMLLLACHMILR